MDVRYLILDNLERLPPKFIPTKHSEISGREREPLGETEKEKEEDEEREGEKKRRREGRREGTRKRGKKDEITA